MLRYLVLLFFVVIIASSVFAEAPADIGLTENDDLDLGKRSTSYQVDDLQTDASSWGLYSAWPSSYYRRPGHYGGWGGRGHYGGWGWGGFGAGNGGYGGWGHGHGGWGGFGLHRRHWG